jgi:hypothetical protein
MEPPEPCPFRYIYKGRTFCAIAIRDRRYTTTEVMPGACDECRARTLLRQIGCAHLSLGVEVDIYGGTLTVNIFYASCERLLERLTDFRRCGEDCPWWAPLDDDRIEALRMEALAGVKEKESRQPD